MIEKGRKTEIFNRGVLSSLLVGGNYQSEGKGADIFENDDATTSIKIIISYYKVAFFLIFKSLTCRRRNE